MGTNANTHLMLWDISLGDGGEYANFLGFGGSVPLLPHLCQLSVPEVGVCRVYLESP